jgi:hypothetical protein
MRTKYWSENLGERDHSEELGVDGKITRNGNMVMNLSGIS